jgi:hypothetical protein
LGSSPASDGAARFLRCHFNREELSDVGNISDDKWAGEPLSVPMIERPPGSGERSAQERAERYPSYFCVTVPVLGFFPMQIKVSIPSLSEILA